MNQELGLEARVLAFHAIGMQNVGLVGGKNASLGEMITKLNSLGLSVPPGFATTANAYFEFLSHNKLTDFIDKHLQKLDISNIGQLKAAGAAIREAILNGELPEALVEAKIGRASCRERV